MQFTRGTKFKEKFYIFETQLNHLYRDFCITKIPMDNVQFSNELAQQKYSSAMQINETLWHVNENICNDRGFFSKK